MTPQQAPPQHPMDVVSAAAEAVDHVVCFDTGTLHCTRCGASATPGSSGEPPTPWAARREAEAFAEAHVGCPPPAASVCLFCHSAAHASDGHVEATTRAPEDWLASGDTGGSSRALWAHMMGRSPTASGLASASTWPAPTTPADFGRCYRLLHVSWASGWRSRLPEMAERSAAWARVVAAWDALSALYLEELPGGNGQRLAERLDALRIQDEESP